MLKIKTINKLIQNFELLMQSSVIDVLDFFMPGLIRHIAESFESSLGVLNRMNL